MKNYVYRSTWWIKLDLNNTVENIEKHLKIQHLFDNPKNTAVMTSIQEVQIFEIQNPKKYSPDPCL